MLGSEFGGERRTHQHAADAGWGGEVRLPALAAGAGDSWVVLHFDLLGLAEDEQDRIG